MSTLSKLLLWLAYRLLRLALPKVVLDHAVFSVSKVEPTPHTGDQKHQLIYKKLLQQFPAMPKRVLSLAVEVAVEKSL